MSRYFLDNAYYFLTVPTTGRQHIFDTPEKKHILLERMREAIQKFLVREVDYGILANHYHLIGYFEKGTAIPQLLQHINGGAAYNLHKGWINSDSNSPIWDEYHIYCIEDELVLSKIRGYVVGNPLKHKEVASFEELSQSPFSSYAHLATRFGQSTVEEWVRSVITIEEGDIISSITKHPD